jgi:hypothetical protein
MSPRLQPALWLLTAAALASAPVSAQQATERFIPLGQSPGLSAGKTLVGRVTSADIGRGVLMLSTPGGLREVAVTGTTRIWLDRTHLGETNVRGALKDCEPTLAVEVKLAEDSATADWVKVRPAPQR